MRIECVKNYCIQNKQFQQKGVKKVLEPPIEPVKQTNPSFKGCNVGKIVGFFAGAIAVAVVAPAVAAVGLAGIGALPGAIIGMKIDEEIDKANGEESD